MNREEVVGYVQSHLGYPLLGRGAQAAVFAVAPDRVIKLCLPPHDPSRWPEARSRFSNEVRLLRRYPHPQLMEVLAEGVLTVESASFPYYEMRRASAQLTAQIPPTNLRQNLGYYAQILQGMSFLHMNGVAHGDIKPENIMLAPNGGLWIADLSDAILLPLGTQPPPDVPVPLRRDLADLGRLLYELLTGRRLRKESPPLGADCGAFVPLDPLLYRLALCPLEERYTGLQEAEQDWSRALPQVLAALP